MPAFRVIFLVFMTWLLVVFLPGHQRGAITLGPGEAAATAEADACCAPPPPPTACCDDDSSSEPTSKDRANCAVCHWAAGLLTTPAFAVDLSHAERAFERARQFHAQVALVACRLNHYGRDPPALPASIVV